MKKITYFTILAILFVFLNGCGYQPIYKSKNINIKIVDYDIEGDPELGQQIYSSLNRIFLEADNAKEVSLFVAATKKKSIALKDSSGNAVKYKLIVNVEFKVTDIFSDKILVNHNSTLSENYGVQDRLTATEALENNIVSNIIERIIQEIIPKLLQGNSP